LTGRIPIKDRLVREESGEHGAHTSLIQGDAGCLFCCADDGYIVNFLVEAPY
jgi:hypothetical protein